MASTLRCRGPEGRQRARSQIIVMGMSRSGSSLTTSIIAAMLRNGSRSDETAWRGHGRALPSDSANPGGYYEREDVVRLNYATISSVTGAGWTSFRPDHLLRPAALNASWRAPSGRARFEASARGILEDMDHHAPWVLKDVRFARTLPVWRPLLRRPLCVIPYRHPGEAASSSRLRSVRLWEEYVMSALTAAREARCPTMLVSFRRWLAPVSASDQARELHSFLHCGEVSGLVSPLDAPSSGLPPPSVSGAPSRAASCEQATTTERLLAAVRPSARRNTQSDSAVPRFSPAISRQLTPAALCLWRELESGRALKGHSQRETPLAAQLCYGSGAGRGPAASPLITTRSG